MGARLFPWSDGGELEKQTLAKKQQGVSNQPLSSIPCPSCPLSLVSCCAVTSLHRITGEYASVRACVDL